MSRFSGILERKKSTKSFDVNVKPCEPTSNEISSFRRYLPQVLASSAKNMLIVDFGLSIAFSTILIPALSGLNPALNPNETLTITPDEATWLASITVICQPIGGFTSGFLTEPLGRKYALIMVNIPYVIAWIMLYYANSLTMIYISFVLLGIGLGLMEAPIFTYIGEICEPSIRGILTATASIAAAFGMGMVYFLGTQTSWRNAALICAMIPILSIIFISFMPETPLWLLSRNRQEDALKSLQWLRGWVDSKTVRNEFNDLQRCRISAQICYQCEKQNKICKHPPPTIRDKVRDLFRRRTLRPFILLASLFFFAAFCGISPYRPYIVQILYFYKSPIDPNQVVVWLGYIGFAANIMLVITIRSFGKRSIYLCSMAFIILILFGLGIYGFVYLPLESTSFDINLNSTHVDENAPAIQYFPIVAFQMLQCLGNFGVSSIPNMMLSEVFPFKSKAFATGIVGALFYLSMFLASKSFYALEVLLTLPGLSIFYGFLGVVGFIAMYLTLPETEGRTLEDIESYFSDRKRKLNDINIPHKNEIS
ncbi:facilitated trehalose transporter Tret1-like isoform X2 [Sitodiplosis mosellana]|uniref:facilitated trehalose transporter Tret1-like isoform X2 n=1 Tax=Sitodiplosis mosellana TaxID=263140 RepID=UPI0024442CC9|nr:facilitated trehalose transporter Tret1-like isoform X2 [Sitodiplosis mosellana]